MKIKYLSATIVRISGGDVIYIKENKTLFSKKERYFGFLVGRIENYHGETLRELGLRPGQVVEFTLDDALRVESVRLTGKSK